MFTVITVIVNPSTHEDPMEAAGCVSHLSSQQPHDGVGRDVLPCLRN